MDASHKADRSPSMFEVAKLAGVSHQTVSRVINDSPHVSASTRARVQQVIDDLGYRPSNSARTLASKRSHTIGLIAGGQHFFGPVSTLASIEELARRHGLFVTVSLIHEALCTQGEFEELCRTFEDQNVDAFVMLAPTDVMFSAACKARLSEPRVLVTSTHGQLGMGQAGRMMSDEDRQRTAIVGLDQWGAMERVAELVAKFGHRSVWYLAGPVQWRDAVTRLAAWRKVSALHSIDTRIIQARSWEAGEAYSLMNRELERLGQSGQNRPTAVITANDAQAVGVYRTLREHGLRVPQDVSVVGFDDMAGMDNMMPPLTTVRPDFDRLGAAAMQEVLRLLGVTGQTSFQESAHGAGLISCEIMQRRSLGPVSRN
ncbi:LacI family DNA-binding transcriptional regulator [Bifidobacterium bombi]|uniref:LacI family DNA-binding transcriptional regulator n=1 Tax=Bifidobacterium bombi TaxID=471511 RepID=UPI0039BFF38D